MPDRLDMFGPPRETTRGAIFVAMATTFALGAESNRLPACLYLSCTSACYFIFRPNFVNTLFDNHSRLLRHVAPDMRINEVRHALYCDNQLF